MHLNSNEILKAAIMGFVLPMLLLGMAMGLSRVSAVSTEPSVPLPAPTAPSTQPSTVPTEPTVSTTAPAEAPTLPPATEPTEPVTTAPTEPEEPPAPVTMEIPVLLSGVLYHMELEDYILGVLLAEMPASFHEEALKAQAVASRTYALRCYIGGTHHIMGAVCNKPSCCHGYTSPEQFLKKGGRQSDLDKLKAAVAATTGQVLTYKGKLALTTYFSCSGGSTEDAAAVWGTDLPYLQAVPSPGEEASLVYAHSQTFTPAQLSEKLGIQMDGFYFQWVGSVSYTPGAGVDTIVICGKTFTGLELRQMLGLRSTIFTLELTPTAITFHTKGFGHRVGMSQYGADAMAVTGKTYEQILAYYYRGTSLGQFARV